MSSWKLTLRALYVLGPATSQQIDTYLFGQVNTFKSLYEAKKLGLVVSPGRGHGTYRPWRLSQRGIDWCEGRLAQVEQRPGGRMFVATWLASLPRDVRIGGAT